MKIDTREFLVKPGAKVDLKRRPTLIAPFYRSKRHYCRLLEGHIAELNRLQGLLWADHRFALLVVIQGMDAAGKDSAVKHVMSGVNPQGCEVHSFRPPSEEELAHDFLWRAARRLPERGHIGIFNRSHYEEVVVVRVHPELLDREGLPAALAERPRVWEGRFRSIVDWERHLRRNGTRIIKFFLHLSKREQRRRFLARIDEPGKNWKFSLGDIGDRKRWGDYRSAYEYCLTATSTDEAPWHVVPADDKANARLIISQVIVDALKGLRLRSPPLTARQKADLRKARRALKK